MKIRNPRLATLLLTTIGVAGGMLAWTVCSSNPPARPPDPALAQAWEKVASRLGEADQDGADAVERRIARINDFFAEKQGRTREFAEDVLGWNGKIAFVMDTVLRKEGRAQQEYIRGSFERHLFNGEELQALLNSTVRGYLSELEGQENELLVLIRADLSDADLPAGQSIAALQSDAAFRDEYRQMVVTVIPLVSRDLKVTIGREAAVWVASDIATAVTVRIGSAVAVRLGVSGGILSTGAASGAATLGVGLVAGFVIDGAADWIMRRAGYDPAGGIAAQASAALANIRKQIVDGEPEAQRMYKQLRDMQDTDRLFLVREQCRKAANRIDAGGSLGLRHELQRLRQQRARLREAALKKMILEGGGQ